MGLDHYVTSLNPHDSTMAIIGSLFNAAYSFEHMDCRLHDIPAFIHTIKFPELTPTTLYNSHLVRLGLMKREEALQIEEDNLRNRQEPRSLDLFLEDIDMSRDEFYASIKDWKKMDGFRDKRNEAMRALYRRIAGR